MTVTPSPLGTKLPRRGPIRTTAWAAVTSPGRRPSIVTLSRATSTGCAASRPSTVDQPVVTLRTSFRRMSRYTGSRSPGKVVYIVVSTIGFATFLRQTSSYETSSTSPPRLRSDLMRRPLSAPSIVRSTTRIALAPPFVLLPIDMPWPE